jgi:hypothetical protein
MNVRSAGRPLGIFQSMKDQLSRRVGISLPDEEVVKEGATLLGTGAV